MIFFSSFFGHYAEFFTAILNHPCAKRATINKNSPLVVNFLSVTTHNIASTLAVVPRIFVLKKQYWIIISDSLGLVFYIIQNSWW